MAFSASSSIIASVRSTRRAASSQVRAIFKKSLVHARSWQSPPSGYTCPHTHEILSATRASKTSQSQGTDDDYTYFGEDWATLP
jgi:hypothetical protein